MLCLLIPTSLLDPYSLQVTPYQIPISSFWTSLGTCLRKPAKQGNLWYSLRDREFSGYGLLVSLLLSHQTGGSMLLPLLCQVIPKMVWIQWWSKVFIFFLELLQRNPALSSIEEHQQHTGTNLLVVMDKLASLKTAWRSAPNFLEALQIYLSISS